MSKRLYQVSMTDQLSQVALGLGRKPENVEYNFFFSWTSLKVSSSMCWFNIAMKRSPFSPLLCHSFLALSLSFVMLLVIPLWSALSTSWVPCPWEQTKIREFWNGGGKEVISHFISYFGYRHISLFHFNE